MSMRYNTVSSFLMKSFNVFFDEIKDMGITCIILTTTLKDNNLDLFRRQIHYICVKHSIDYRIHIENKLHGKIYIASKNGVQLGGIITSANFTEAELGCNHEWGIRVDNSIELINLINDISSVRSDTLSDEQLKKIIKEINNYYKDNGAIKESKLDLKVSNFIKDNIHISKSERHFFLRPVGWSE